MQLHTISKRWERICDGIRYKRTALSENTVQNWAQKPKYGTELGTKNATVLTWNICQRAATVAKSEGHSSSSWS